MASRFPARTTSDPSVTSWGKPVVAGIGYGTATGGTSSPITVDGINYTLLTFTSDDNLVVSKDGLFDYLVIGSGGGSDNAVFGNGAGGGGGGQLVEGTAYLTAATYAVYVGAGSAHNAQNKGTSGIGNEIFALQGSGSTTTTTPGAYGASGSGGKGAGSVQSGGTAAINAVTGYAGGSSSNTSPNFPGGGGGGFTGDGTSASGGTAGSGGAGISNSFNGVATTYCRGGFGGSYNGTQNAAANTGNGGGNAVGFFGAGGSGLVLVRFKV